MANIIMGMKSGTGVARSMPSSAAEPAALGDQRHHAVGGADRQQVHQGRLERDERRAEHTSSNRNDSTSTAPMNSGSRSAT